MNSALDGDFHCYAKPFLRMASVPFVHHRESFQASDGWIPIDRCVVIGIPIDFTKNSDGSSKVYPSDWISKVLPVTLIGAPKFTAQKVQLLLFNILGFH